MIAGIAICVPRIAASLVTVVVVATLILTCTHPVSQPAMIGRVRRARQPAERASFRHRELSGSHQHNYCPHAAKASRRGHRHLWAAAVAALKAAHPFDLAVKSRLVRLALAHSVENRVVCALEQHQLEKYSYTRSAESCSGNP